jgi:hypothetical protein
MSCWKKYRACKFKGYSKNEKQIIESFKTWLLRMYKFKGYAALCLQQVGKDNEEVTNEW